MAQINIGMIKTQIAKDTGYTNTVLKKAATERAQLIFNDAILVLKRDFEESEVTKEIEGGIASPNISNTLGGGDAPKNLFSFIGFDENGPNPVEPIRKLLDPSNPSGPKLGPAVKIPDQLPKFSFTVDVSKTKEQIFEKTPMPWGAGLSWAEKIETSIPGFANFLNRFTKTVGADGKFVSRSGGGTQTKNQLRPDTFTPPQKGYISTLLANFIDNINKSKRIRPQ
jgi:hypothetical protein